MKKHALVPLLLSAAALAGCSNAGSSDPGVLVETSTTASTTMTFDTTAQTTTTAAPETTAPAETTAAAADTTAQHETKSSDDAEASYPADEQMLVDEAYSAGYQDGDEKAAQRMLRISGDFTATVRAIMPDYVSDPETPRAAVITFFQDEPVLVYMAPAFLVKMKEGETYTFVLQGQEDLIGVIHWWDEESGSIDSRALANVFLNLSEVREPTEDEEGLLCNRIKAAPAVYGTDTDTDSE